MSNLKVTTNENGPTIVEHTDGSKVAICTCGKSINGKTCDGSHRK